MNNSSFNHSNKERRLIHFADEAPSAGAESPEIPEQQLAALRNQVSAGARARFDALNLAWEKTGETLLDRMAALTAFSQLSDREENELFVQGAALAEKLGPDGVAKILEMYAARKAGNDEEFKRIFASMSPEDHEAVLKNNSPVLKKFGELIEGQSKVDQFGNKVENFLERNEDQITRFIALIANIMQQFQALMDQFHDALEYNPRVQAKKDKFIDKQIGDPKVSKEIISKHKTSTITELKKIDSAGDTGSIEKKKAKLEDYETERKDALAAVNPKTSKLPTATEQDAINKRIDDAIAKTKKEIADMEAAQQAGETRKPELLARLAAINERMNIPDPLNGYKTTSTESVAETEPAEEVSPTKTPEETAKKKEVLVEATKNFKEAFTNLTDAATSGEEIKTDETDIDPNLEKMRTVLDTVKEEDSRLKVLAEVGIYTPAPSGGAPSYSKELKGKTDAVAYEIYYKDKVLKLKKPDESSDV
jgi:hypothetical protein